jgi:hypothetical protein
MESKKKKIEIKRKQKKRRYEGGIYREGNKRGKDLCTKGKT